MPGIETLALIVSSIATTTFAANALYLGTLGLAYAGAAYAGQLLSGLLVDKPSVPKPEDGSYNLKQSVPPLSFVLGRNKKPSDYLALEETEGAAYHILCPASHRIQGFVEHYLHDAKVTLKSDGGVIDPGNFDKDGVSFVNIQTRLGLNAETAYPDMVTAFPSIWTANHRGDGLATVRLKVESVGQEDYMEVFPNQMPLHTAVIDGALLFDPRKPAHVAGNPSTYSFAQNLALFRLWHLTQPVGGKLSISDLYLPEWQHAADVCDQAVLNRAGVSEPRYHGGLWFRANNDPVQVGRLIDQAGELVVYERPDGLVGVHAGEFVEPDIRLTADDIINCSFKANSSKNTTVLAVRGRFTSPDHTYNTVDAAIWGNPYIGDDTERTKTIDNQAVQSHNHMQRLQKIAMIRANAPRVACLAHYETAKNVPYRRFIRVHLPPRMEEAIVEITSTPKVSLANLTVEFSGIVVPSTLYAFIAAAEEGAPPTVPIYVVKTGVPKPTNFNVVIQTENVSGSTKAAYGLGTWTFKSASLLYEFEWQATTGSNQLAFSSMSKKNDVAIRSSYLGDSKTYRFRLRAWSAGKASEWTDYITRDVEVDPVAPGTPVNLLAPNSATNVQISARSANDNTAALVFKRGTTAQSFTDATLIGRYLVAPNQVISLTDAPGAGTYKYWCGAENASGKPSAAQASTTTVVT